jgi:hypothetical protein
VTHPVWLFLSAIVVAPPPVQTDQTIVVTGARPTRDAIANYVDGITANVDGQIATFRQPICPGSFGLPEAYNRVIEQRLRADATRVGLRVAGEQCDANIIVIVADDPRPLVAKLQRERPQMFVGLDFEQVQNILRTKEPVLTWQAVEPHGSDGRPLERVMFVGGRAVGGDGAWLNPAASNSRIQQNIRPDLVSSFVMLNADDVDGLTLTQIADYAAMRALARTRGSERLRAPTILALFDKPEGSAVGQLSRWDLAYLRALYATDNRLAAHSQQAAIAGAIRRDLNQPDQP